MRLFSDSVSLSLSLCSASRLCRLRRHITSRLLFKLRFLCRWTMRPAAWSPAFRSQVPVHGRRQQSLYLIVTGTAFWRGTLYAQYRPRARRRVT